MKNNKKLKTSITIAISSINLNNTNKLNRVKLIFLLFHSQNRTYLHSNKYFYGAKSYMLYIK